MASSSNLYYRLGIRISRSWRRNGIRKFNSRSACNRNYCDFVQHHIRKKATGLNSKLKHYKVCNFRRPFFMSSVNTYLRWFPLKNP